MGSLLSKRLWPVYAAVLLAFIAGAAEKVPLVMPGGQTLRCDVLKFTANDVTLKADGKEQTIPLAVLTPQEVLRCYTEAGDMNNAELRLHMGKYCLNKELFDRADDEVKAAMRLDPKMKTKSEELLQKIATARGVSKVAALPEKKKAEEPPKPPAEVPPPPKKEKKPGSNIQVMEIGEDGLPEEFAKKFEREDVPARSDADMKKFLDKRLAELKDMNPNWRLIETKHFYCFSNIPEAKHQQVSLWNEELYKLQCQIMNHRDGVDKLWNNKCPIYYFENRGQFQRFARDIDKSPGAAYSGGYFSPHGRDVHICIPFYTTEMGEKKADYAARSTLYHEGTHAFLQLTGEDVKLSRWLHEGMAQFMEFWLENIPNGDPSPPKNPIRADHVQFFSQKKTFETWSEMAQRPTFGGDSEGYAYAWSKLEFLYRNFDNQRLPQMIRMIKSGKTEEEAMTAAFGHSPKELEAAYGNWMRETSRQGFKFENR